MAEQTDWLLWVQSYVDLEAILALFMAFVLLYVYPIRVVARAPKMATAAAVVPLAVVIHLFWQISTGQFDVNVWILLGLLLPPLLDPLSIGLARLARLRGRFFDFGILSRISEIASSTIYILLLLLAWFWAKVCLIFADRYRTPTPREFKEILNRAINNPPRRSLLSMVNSTLGRRPPVVVHVPTGLPFTNLSQVQFSLFENGVSTTPRAPFNERTSRPGEVTIPAPLRAPVVGRPILRVLCQSLSRFQWRMFTWCRRKTFDL